MDGDFPSSGHWNILNSTVEVIYIYLCCDWFVDAVIPYFHLYFAGGIVEAVILVPVQKNIQTKNNAKWADTTV